MERKSRKSLIDCLLLSLDSIQISVLFRKREGKESTSVEEKYSLFVATPPLCRFVFFLRISTFQLGKTGRWLLWDFEEKNPGNG